MRGRLNDSEVYLDEGQLPAFSLSVTALTDPSKIKGTTSTTLRILATPEAKRVVGSEFMAQRPLGRPVLRIGEDSVDLFRSEVKVLEQDRGVIEAIAVSGNATWFEYAKNLKLREFDFGDTPIVDAAFQRDSWDDETQIVSFPLIDFGSLKNMNYTTSVAVEKLRPGVRWYRVLQEAFKAGGYTIQAKGSFSRDWKIPFDIWPGGKPQSRSIDPNPDLSEIRTSGPGAGSLVTTKPIGEEPGKSSMLVVSDPAGHIEGFDYTVRYKMPFDGDLAVRFWKFTILGVPTELDGTRLRLVLYNITESTPVVQVYSDVLVSGTDYEWTGEFPDIPALKDEEFFVGFSNETDSNVDITLDDASPFPGRVYYQPSTRPYMAGCPLIINTCLPDLTLVEYLKAWMNDQCLVCSTSPNGKVISLWRDKDYYMKPREGGIYRDWTSLIDHTIAPKKANPQKTRKLLFRFDTDEGDRSIRQTNLVPSPGFANADVAIGGLDKEDTIELPAAPTAMGFRFPGTGLPFRIPLMIDVDAEPDVDEYGRKHRMLMLDKTVLGFWTHDGDDMNVVPNCYFSATDRISATRRPLEVGFANMVVFGDEVSRGTIAAYWGNRLRRLKESRTIEAYFLIRDNELRNFHHGIPTLVDDGSGPRWYYVQEIFQHRFGKNVPTKCILVEIPGAEVNLPAPVNGPVSYPPVVPEPEVVLGTFSWSDTNGLLYTVGGSTYIVVLNDVGGLSPGSDPGTFGSDPVNGLELTQGADVYTVVLNTSGLSAGDPDYGTFSWDNTYGLLLTKDGTTYQVDILEQ